MDVARRIEPPGPSSRRRRGRTAAARAAGTAGRARTRGCGVSAGTPTSAAAAEPGSRPNSPPGPSRRCAAPTPAGPAARAIDLRSPGSADLRGRARAAQVRVGLGLGSPARYRRAPAPGGSAISNGTPAPPWGGRCARRPLALSKLVKKVNPASSTPCSSTIRASGMPSASTVARVMALASLGSALTASASHLANSSIGSRSEIGASGSASATFCK